jgi:hypothetical protein
MKTPEERAEQIKREFDLWEIARRLPEIIREARQEVVQAEREGIEQLVESARAEARENYRNGYSNYHAGGHDMAVRLKDAIRARTEADAKQGGASA